VRLIIVHYHFRPGGVRRVIELGTPWVAAAVGADEILLAGGEPPETAWLEHFQARLGKRRVRTAACAAAGYWAEIRKSPAAAARDVERFCASWASGAASGETVVWAHNQGLGRNLLLTQALAQTCAAHEIPLFLHHHDWWFDNRWQRWPEMRAAGFRTLAHVARVIFPLLPLARHLAINHADAAVLQKHFPGQSGWLPNLSEPGDLPTVREARQARQWLRRQLGDDAPVWLMPCRLLRRKNLAEALLLQRWLRPEAWLVTTGALSSADERAYARRLAAAAQRHRWRLRLSLLQGPERGKPSVPALLAASEAMVLTSLQEGFGLPFLEAAQAGKPLLARALPNIAPDLARFGLIFPQYYDEIWVPPTLFDAPAEARRQQQLYRRWKALMPAPCRAMTPPPPLLAHGGAPAATPFSRLTLTAQLEVLSHPPEESWTACVGLNPFLRIWRELAQAGQLRPCTWPRSAARWLSGAAYQRHFTESLRQPAPAPAAPAQAVAAQLDFMRLKLASENLYPLLWSTAW
jgi:glycosyltransferase involved in cell wall biosynthesis